MNNRSSSTIADLEIVFKPEHRPRHPGTTSPARSWSASVWDRDFVEQALRVRHRTLRTSATGCAAPTSLRPRLREGHPGSRTIREVTLDRQEAIAQRRDPDAPPVVEQNNTKQGGQAHWLITFEEFRKRRRSLHAGVRRGAGEGRLPTRLDRVVHKSKLKPARRSTTRIPTAGSHGRLVLDHGLQSARAVAAWVNELAYMPFTC